jgi:hypothetical protein
MSKAKQRVSDMKTLISSIEFNAGYYSYFNPGYSEQQWLFMLLNVRLACHISGCSSSPFHCAISRVKWSFVADKMPVRHFFPLTTIILLLAYTHLSLSLSCAMGLTSHYNFGHSLTHKAQFKLYVHLL